MGEPVVVVMGASGCGKTTVGLLLSESTGWAFADADSLHSPEAVAKMRDGIPLTDADRWPWLDQIAAWIADRRAAGDGGVVACSALKRSYRDRLREADPDLRLVYLDGERQELIDRLTHRHGHFFPRTLLEAQLADLEEPTPDESPIVVPIGQSPPDEVETVLRALGRAG